MADFVDSEAEESDVRILPQLKAGMRIPAPENC
jgi:hypothetical protein